MFSNISTVLFIIKNGPPAQELTYEMSTFKGGGPWGTRRICSK